MNVNQGKYPLSPVGNVVACRIEIKVVGVLVEATKIFVVLDPTSMEQPTLLWGEEIVRAFKVHRSVDATLHVYCCINEDSVALVPGNQARAETLERVRSWLERLVNQSRAEGIAVETEVEWSDEWRKAIVSAAARQNSSLVVKNMTQHSRFVRLLRETSDWTLIRECECPILLLKTGRPFRIEEILVAVKHSPGDETYEKANDDILAAARRVATDFGASLHAVTCYDPDKHPDRQRFADRCGLQRSQVSAATGSPAQIIAETAAQQGSDLLIIARVARPDSPRLVGNTARRVIDEIDTETLVLPVN